MIINGKILYQVKSGGGIVNGNPVPVQVDWLPIECNIKTNSNTTKGRYIDGNFRMASYEVLIELTDFTANRVKLVDIMGRDLGEFPVQSIEHLEAVQNTKIVV